MQKLIQQLCREYTDLSEEEIQVIEMMAQTLQPLANLEAADIFVDCPCKDKDAIVVAEAKPEQALPHDLILEGRNKLTVTGVRRVIRCDAEGAAMLTSKGTLELTGAELSVTSLDLDKGEVKLTGRVDTLEYTAEHTPGGFLRRLVR